jgi:hypothetical protein
VSCPKRKTGIGSSSLFDNDLRNRLSFELRRFSGIELPRSFLFPLARLKSGLDADKGAERKIIHPLLLSVFPKRVIDVFTVVEVLDVDISVQAPLFESEPLFEPKLEPVVGRIATGNSPCSSNLI